WTTDLRHVWTAIALSFCVCLNYAAASVAVAPPASGERFITVQDEVRAPKEERRVEPEARSREEANRFDEIQRSRELERGTARDANARETAQRAAERRNESGGRFDSEVKLEDHWNRHGRDFGATSPAEYERQANRFLNGPRDPD